MKLVKWIALAASMIINQQAMAVGAHSNTLKLHCDGLLEVTGVEDVGVTGGFHDRAGNYHPPKGYADLTVEMVQMSPKCEKMESKLQIDVDKNKFSKTIFFKSINRNSLWKMAQDKIGETKWFKAEQVFGYMDKTGYLPFFPLIHQESVQLKVEGNFLHITYQVDENKVYDIHLNDDEKILLAEMIFDHFDKEETNGISKYSLITPLLSNHPSFSTDFEPYLEKVLHYYQLAEQKEFSDENDTSIDWPTYYFAKGIIPMTKKYPQANAFDIPDLLANFPTILVQKGFSGLSCPAMTAADLDEALLLLEESLEKESLHPEVKASFEKILLYASGGIHGGGGCAKQFSSLFGKEKAKELLNKYYK